MTTIFFPSKGGRDFWWKHLSLFTICVGPLLGEGAVVPNQVLALPRQPPDILLPL